MFDGTYASLAELNAKYSTETITALADRNGDGSVDTATIQRVWAEVDAEINAHLITAGYTKESLGGVPPLLKNIALDLAFACLHTNKLGELAEARTKTARDTLKFISKGQLKLSAPTSTSEVNRKFAQAQAQSKPKSQIEDL